MSRVGNWINPIVAVLGLLLTIGTQTPIDTAMSNLGSYWRALGFDFVPLWMSARTADTWAFYVGIGLFVPAGIVTILRYWTARTRKTFFERDYLEIYQLAYLSCDKRPRADVRMPDDVLHRHRLLKDAINDGKLVAQNLNPDGDANVMTKVQLQDFCNFAKENRHREFGRVARRWMAYHHGAKGESSKGDDQKLDLSVSLKQFVKKHDVWLMDAVQYVTTGSWNNPDATITSIATNADNLFKAADAIRQAAYDGDLTIWGMNNFSGPLVAIEQEYWKHHSFDRFGLLKGNREEWKTEYRTNNRAQPIYRSLKTTKTEVEVLRSRIEEDLIRGFNHAKSRLVTTKDAAVLHLTELREEGVRIRNAAYAIANTSNLDVWSSNVTEWMNDTIAAIGAIDRADSRWFATLDTVPPARVPIPNVQVAGDFDPRVFSSTFRQHDCRLARLDRLLQKYGVGVSP